MSVRNLRVHPEAVLLFEADRGDEAGSVLRLRGPAVVHPGCPSVGVLIRIGLKYYLAPGFFAASSRTSPAKDCGGATTASRSRP